MGRSPAAKALGAEGTRERAVATDISIRRPTARVGPCGALTRRRVRGPPPSPVPQKARSVPESRAVTAPPAREIRTACAPIANRERKSEGGSAGLWCLCCGWACTGPVWSGASGNRCLHRFHWHHVLPAGRAVQRGEMALRPRIMRQKARSRPSSANAPEGDPTRSMSGGWWATLESNQA